MLTHAKEYVEEHGGNPRDLLLAGQENSGSVWSISKMNLLLHGIPGAKIENDDTLRHRHPACVLVLRAPGSKPPDQAGRVLFGRR